MEGILSGQELKVAEVRPSPLHGRGLFVARRIQKALTPVAVYGGIAKRPQAVMRRSLAVVAEPGTDAEEQQEGEDLPTRTVIAKLRYLINTYDDSAVLDPTDDEGQLLAEYDAPHFTAHCVNEPPSISVTRGAVSEDAQVDVEGMMPLARMPNACFVQNHHSKRTEIWSLRAVEQGEEIYVYYGGGVYRDYDVHPRLLQINNLGLVVSEHTGKVCTVQFDSKEYSCTDPEQLAALEKAVEKAGATSWLSELLNSLTTEIESTSVAL